MLSKRIIACLDVKGDRVVKGTRFVDLRDQGDPVELAERYQQQGADEVVFLDISATQEERRTLWDVVQRCAERLFVPLTVGGGIRSSEDVGRALRAGADKVAINSAAVQRPEILTESAGLFGAQCVVISIDAKRTDSGYVVCTHGGSRSTDLEAMAWARECAEKGAGEVLLTSIDGDGSRSGFDVELTGAMCKAVSIPVVASGGAGKAKDFVDVFKETGCDAALAAGIFHDGVFTIDEVKRELEGAGFPVRREIEVETG